MTTQRFTIILLIAACLQGCATTVAIQSQASKDQKTIFESGTESIISTKSALVAVRPESQIYQSTKRPTFIVTVHNGTGNEFNFSTENISASFNEDDLKIFTYDELVEEIEKQRQMALIATALAGAAQSISASYAGNQYQYGSYNANTYGTVNNPYGYSNSYSGYGSGTYSGYSYNAAAAQQAQALAQIQTSQNIERISSSAEQSLSELSNIMLRKQTVFPDGWHGGYVKTKIPKLSKEDNILTFYVEVADEQHMFQFSLNTVQK